MDHFFGGALIRSSAVAFDISAFFSTFLHELVGLDAAVGLVDPDGQQLLAAPAHLCSTVPDPNRSMNYCLYQRWPSPKPSP